MKNFLLFSVFLFALIFPTHSQVIQIVGIGTEGNPESILIIPDPSTVDRIDVGAIKSWGPSISASDLIFSNFMGPGATIVNSDIINRSGFPSAPGEYLTSSFNSVDGSGIALKIVEDSNSFKDFVKSFYAFVYRNNMTSAFKSYTSLETVYCYSDNDISIPSGYTYEISINTANSSRDIIVKIPISELNDDNRPVEIEVTAGSVTINDSVTTYDSGDSFIIKEYLLEDVEGNVNMIYVDVYSPNPKKGERNGDSFYVNGIVVDVEQTYDGCTLTQGYWKTHSNCKPGNGRGGPPRDPTWDELPGGGAEETIFFLSEQNYCEVYDSKPKDSKYYILAHQYIATQLNLLNDANPTDVADAFNEATEFLKMYDQDDVNLSKSLQDDCVRLGGILDDFNNGRIGPGHCDDDEEDETAEPIKQERQKVSIYPNPAVDTGKIAFTSKQSGISSVELYSINGLKVGTLFNSKTKKGDDIVIEYDSSQLKQGIYFAVIKNGGNVYKEKISIVK